MRKNSIKNTRINGEVQRAYNPIISDGGWIFLSPGVLPGYSNLSLVYFFWRCGSVSILLQL